MNKKPPWLSKCKPKNKPENKKLINTRTNNDHYEIYNDRKLWREPSTRFRISNPVCNMCDRLIPNPKDKKKGSVCDHIIPIDQGGAIYDERNWQILCKHPCHDIKSGRDQKKYTGPFQVLANGKKIPI